MATFSLPKELLWQVDLRYLLSARFGLQLASFLWPFKLSWSLFFRRMATNCTFHEVENIFFQYKSMLEKCSIYLKFSYVSEPSHLHTIHYYYTTTCMRCFVVIQHVWNIQMQVHKNVSLKNILLTGNCKIISWQVCQVVFLTSWLDSKHCEYQNKVRNSREPTKSLYIDKKERKWKDKWWSTNKYTAN